MSSVSWVLDKSTECYIEVSSVFYVRSLVMHQSYFSADEEYLEPQALVLY